MILILIMLFAEARFAHRIMSMIKIRSRKGTD
jgi:hypothetical protein